jgi:transcriptional regulator with XRE-family HTH domain
MGRSYGDGAAAAPPTGWHLRLREVRRSLGLSLHDVQALSRTEFKASVLGAYERGDRIITVGRFLRLAELYGVDPQSLLEADVDDPLGADDGAGDVVIDLREGVRTGHPDAPAHLDLDDATVSIPADAPAHAVARFVAHVVDCRAEHTTGPVRLRAADAETLAAALGLEPDGLVKVLAVLGAVAPVG